MKITYKGEYGLRALLDLAARHGDGAVTPLTEIARRQTIPVKYLEQIMLRLKGAGYVASKRGAGGGFLLMRAPDEIRVGDVIRLLEGPLEPAGDRVVSNPDEVGRALQEVWGRVTESITGIVDSVTFADILRRAAELREEGAGYMYQI